MVSTNTNKYINRYSNIKRDKITTAATQLRVHQEQLNDMIQNARYGSTTKEEEQKTSQQERLNVYNSLHRDMVTKKHQEVKGQSYNNPTFIPDFADKNFLSQRLKS